MSHVNSNTIEDLGDRKEVHCSSKDEIKEITTNKESSDCKSIKDEEKPSPVRASPRRQNDVKTISSFNKQTVNENADKSTVFNSSRPAT